MDPVHEGVGGDPTAFQQQVEAALAKVRPALQADGGDIVLVAVDGQDARVRLKGACHGLPGAQRTLQFGVQRFLQHEVPGFGRVIDDAENDEEDEWIKRM
jgi:Fe-S cluster biogenesis protein NfuA